MTLPALIPPPARLEPREGACALRELPRRIACPPPAAEAAERLAAALPGWSLCWVDDVAAGVRFALDEALAGEGYRLDVAADGVTIWAGEARGFAYGEATLRQLLRAVGDGPLPCLAIEDAPRFAVRGAMLDISRDRVPQQRELLAWIDRLADWKINQLQLYCEHTFAYQRHPDVWREASPLTALELRELGRRAAARGVELVPCTNTLGHMERWLKHDRYRPLAECPDGFVDPWGKTRAVGSTLAAVLPGSLALVGEILEELLPCFDSPQVNIGGDEPFELGQGRSAEGVRERGKRAVYLEHLRGVLARVESHGRRAQCWADVLLSEPEGEARALAEALPPELTCLVWGYEAGHPWVEQASRLRAIGVPVVLAPGTSSWNTIGGRGRVMRANILEAVDAADQAGADGLLITDWGDNGHWQQPAIAWSGLALGAAAAWNPTGARSLPLTDALDRELGAGGGQVRAMLGEVSALSGAEPANATLLARLLQQPLTPLSHWREAGLSAEGAARCLAQAEASVEAAARLPGDGAQLRQAARLQRHAARLAVARLREAPDGATSSLAAATRARLAAELVALLVEQRRCWLASSRPGGLADSLARFEPLQAAYRGES